ncbi:hypothetical protein TWF788_004376 [Orbilia oligospora]|uniref:Uncharacterized protein n=1 Tax=Orbilia oligospora TaxID=2813651 RepID=A0A7C8PZY1_ORBOL|nr:hypothetical protein TWF788_004376 [Orbilia oligospora]
MPASYPSNYPPRVDHYQTMEATSKASPEASPETTTEDKLDRIAREFHFCPNRIWQVVKDLEENAMVKILEFLVRLRRKKESIGSQVGHEICGFEFCEKARIDFTGVVQRHVCDDKDCEQYDFDMSLLDEAVEEGELTAWELDCSKPIERPTPYMAVSHVWSDGTGSGPWASGKVNKCLYDFFADIAARFQCDGIWWDTISIPTGKTTRGKAIATMHRNYESARITLVHDAFLREWEWVDAETACFAISMSPWFSRGWTALELVKSPKVKIIFRHNVIKDLDQDILSKVNPSIPEHRILSEKIKNLRGGAIASIDQLLGVLRARSTSWPRDIAIISAQLVGASVEPSLSQQEIYREALRKVGEIKSSHLFHNSLTMVGDFQWCPTNLLEMPPATPKDTTLKITKKGGINGRWLWSSDIKTVKNLIILENMHRIQRSRVTRILQNSEGPEHQYRILVDPKYKKESGFKALLVLEGTRRGGPMHVEFIASLKFHSRMEALKLKIDWKESNVTIVGNNFNRIQSAIFPVTTPPLQRTEPSDNNNADDKAKLEAANPDENTELHMAAQSGDTEGIQKLLTSTSPYETNRFGMTPLHLAARDGRTKFVKELLLHHDFMHDAPTFDYGDNDSWTPLDHAVWQCHEGVTKAIFEHRYFSPEILNDQDELGQTTLHLAAERANRTIIKGFQLEDIRGRKVVMDIVCESNQNIFHRAALGGSREVIKELWKKAVKFYENDKEKASEMMLEAVDDNDQTPLHIAVQQGNFDAACELADLAPHVLEIEDCDNLTPLEIAIDNNDEEIVQELHERIISNELSSVTGHVYLNIIKKLTAGIPAGHKSLESRNREGKTPLALAAYNGWFSVVERLLRKKANPEAKDNEGKTPLQLALKDAEDDDIDSFVVAKLLLRSKDQEHLIEKLTTSEASQILRMALQQRTKGIAKLALERSRADVHSSGGTLTPFEYAIEWGDKEILDLLIQKTPPIPDPNIDKTINLILEKPSSAAILSKLIKANILPLDESDRRKVVLDYAAKNGHIDLMEQILEKVLMVDYTASDSTTPLFDAICFLSFTGHVRIEVVFQRGTRLGSPQKCHQPETFLIENTREQIVKKLLELGAKPGATDENRQTPLFQAVKRGYPGIVKLLLDHGANVNARDSEGKTPLFYANYETTKLLIDRGASSEIPDKNKKSVLQYAIDQGDTRALDIYSKQGIKNKNKAQEVRDYLQKNPSRRI